MNSRQFGAGFPFDSRWGKVALVMGLTLPLVGCGVLGGSSLGVFLAFLALLLAAARCGSKPGVDLIDVSHTETSSETGDFPDAGDFFSLDTALGEVQEEAKGEEDRVAHPDIPVGLDTEVDT